MRIVLSLTLLFFLGLVVLSVAGIFFAIAVPIMSRQEAVVVGPTNSEWAPIPKNEVGTASSIPPGGMNHQSIVVEAVPGSVVLPGPGVTQNVVPTSSTRVGLAVFPLMLLGFVVLGVIGAVGKLFRGNGHYGSREDPDEVRMMQEIYQGLSGLERRVESLETLLLDRAMAREGEGWKKG
jgi:hypothetical protein